MKRLSCLVALLAGVAGARADAPALRPFEDFQIILDRQPFGEPPANVEPERVVRVEESFAAGMVLSGIYEMEDGQLRVAVTDQKNSTYFALMVGETNDAGIVLFDVDYDAEWAILEKEGIQITLKMGGAATAEAPSATEREERVKEAEVRRMSYAERRKARMEARQKPLDIPKPKYTGEALEQHLQEYQMEVLRKGLPPLPVQLTADRDRQLVEEGILPPVDEEGFEILPADEESGEEYYEDEY